MKKVVPFFVIGLLFLRCTPSETQPEKLFDLPKKLKEISGITSVDNSIWAIADSGNKNVLFQLTEAGDIANEITIANAENIDWEDLASDTEGNIYIGDFGNNDNIRKDLYIYKISKDSLDTEETDAVAKISFSYPEQKDFPPKKLELLYDAEAFIVYNNHFYIFTKNRSKNFDGTTLLYRVPMTAGNHQATLMGSYKTDDTFNSGAVTGAAISPNQKRIAILSHQKVWLFEDFKEDAFFDGKISEINLNHNSQKEAIAFKNGNTLFIADEKVKKSGGIVYQFDLNP
ncbi:hypothetical protein [Flavobacterium sp.]|uniref:hypothetical protein n=1 Tax=Flavobacterium sp. TaxID=239 RepID=UPI0028BEA2A1|nr:hypothetical protein [Flavobacterium sp.]